MSERAQSWRSIALILSSIGLGAALPASAGSPDPTRPPHVDATVVGDDAQQAPTSVFELSAVVFASGRRVAVVNDTRVREGEMVGNARVEEIGARHVRLVREGETIDLSLAREDVKRSPDRSNDVMPFLGPEATDRVTEGTPEMKGKPE